MAGKLSLALVAESLKEIRADSHEPDLEEIKEIEDETLLAEILAELRKLTKSQSRNSGLSELRWFSTAQAAEWYGDTSPDRFRKLAKQYNIPRHGHARNIYDKFELDEWILNPRCFLDTNSPFLRRGRRGTSMAAIQNIVWAAVKDSLRDFDEILNQEG